jgi:hypothetical protein
MSIAVEESVCQWCGAPIYLVRVSINNWEWVTDAANSLSVVPDRQHEPKVLRCQVGSAVVVGGMVTGSSVALMPSLRRFPARLEVCHFSILIVRVVVAPQSSQV